MKGAAFVAVHAPIQLRFCNIRIRDGQLIPGAVNIPAIADPVDTPTIAVSGSGGSLQVGTYYLKYTDTNAVGETLASPESAQFTQISGDEPVVTMAAVPTGTVHRKIYLTPTNGAVGTETLYATQSSPATTYTMVAAYTAGGAVPPTTNTTAAYAAGVTSMNVLFGTNVAVTTGSVFTIGGDPDPNQASQTFTSQFGIYRITAHTETSGSTTSITFTPALDQVVANGEALTVGPNAMIIKVGEGNMTFNEKRTIVYVRDRGILDTVRFGDDEPVDVKLDFIWEFLQATSGSGTPTVEDALKQRGEAANWVTSSSDPCEPYAVDIEVEYVPPCPGTQRETWLFKDFRYEELSHDLKQAQVSITGKCNVHQVIDTRAA